MKAAKERNELQIIQSDLLNAIKVGYRHKNILKVQKWNHTRNRSSRISPPFYPHFPLTRMFISSEFYTSPRFHPRLDFNFIRMLMSPLLPEKLQILPYSDRDIPNFTSHLNLTLS